MNTNADLMYAYGASADIRHDDCIFCLIGKDDISCSFVFKLLCSYQRFLYALYIYIYTLVVSDIEAVEKHRERASEQGEQDSERTQLHGANTNSSKSRNNNTETLPGANSKSSKNRSNKTETAHTTQLNKQTGI